MCGICGIYNLSGKPVARDEVTRMNDEMTHRGPDADGLYLHENLGFGHRRLKIIDLEGGVQPMFSADRNLVIVFNGEIYNFQEVRSELEKTGFEFRTSSDTEVIIRAYEKYGESFIDRLRGMFTIALFDHRERKLLLYRDRLGIKPLYYYLDDERLLFASEVKPILQALGRPARVDLAGLDFYMSVGYVPGENTLFEGIRKLAPGHSLKLQDKRVSIGCYWDLENVPAQDLGFDEALEIFDRKLSETVRMHAISDVPLGAFLSGGLDSSVIVALLGKLSGSRVKTFSVGYKDSPEESELGYAEIVARHCNTEHHELILEPLAFFDSLDLLLQHSEEPIIESAAVALYQLSKLTKEHVTVVLSGEGGDEILAGYPLHQIMPKIDRLHLLSRGIPGFFKQRISPVFAGNEKLSKYWDWICLPLENRYQSISNDVTGSIKNRMYKSREILCSQENTNRYYASLFDKLDRGTALRKMTYSDIKSWLPDDLLIKADKMTMAASLELRVPFLDHEIVEFATTLPDSYRLRGRQGKYLLRKYAESLIPGEIINRKKKGFPVPISGWFRGVLFEKTREILLDPHSLERGYFNPAYIENMLNRHRQGSEDLSRRIFSMLNLELWHQKYID